MCLSPQICRLRLHRLLGREQEDGRFEERATKGAQMETDKIVTAIAALIESLGMYSDNQSRLSQGYSVSYTEGDFAGIANDLRSCLQPASTQKPLTFLDGYYCALAKVLQYDGQGAPVRWPAYSDR